MNPADDLRFVKGHGTENDFVVLADPSAEIDLDTELIAAVCDRRRGLGADGLLRVARAGALVERGVLGGLPTGVAPDDWFMDYRNADGSIAEMCGNGVRVFAHYVRSAGLTESDEFTVGSRAGARPVVVHSHDDVNADVSVSMGEAKVTAHSAVRIGDQEFEGIAVDVGNPHLACVLDGLTPAALAQIDLTGAVALDDAVFPAGANIELVTPAIGEPAGVLTAAMRVHERGVGETRSCGTGLVAAAVASLRARGEAEGRLSITVPGGVAEVVVSAEGTTLRGPSMLVANGILRPGWQGVRPPTPE